MIYTITLNPALDKTVMVSRLNLDLLNRVTVLRTDPGGKGINVSKVMKKLGYPSIPFVILAGDTGDTIKGMLAEAGIEFRSFDVEGETRTNLKIIDPVSNTRTDINEAGPEVTGELIDEVLAKLLGLVEAGDIVVLAGSLAYGAPADTYRAWTLALKEAGVRVYLDTDGANLISGLEGEPDFVKIYEAELGKLLGRKLRSDADVAEAARELVARGVPQVLVLQGEAGALYACPERAVKCHPIQVPIGSTVGAADAMVAAFAYGEVTGMGLDDTLRLAIAAGAANAMQAGTQAAPRKLIDELVGDVELTEL